jgi:hypothetical protein
MSRFDDKPHYVYVFAAEDGHVLYVGCTASLLVRMQTHASTQPWWPRVRHVEWSLQADKAAGLAEEERLTSPQARVRRLSARRHARREGRSHAARSSGARPRTPCALHVAELPPLRGDGLPPARDRHRQHRRMTTARAPAATDAL